MIPFTLILPAAGSASRFGRNKLLEPLGGAPVVRRALQAFTRRRDVACIVIPTSPAGAADLKNALLDVAGAALDPRIHFCTGGENRAASVYRALQEAPADVQWVAVHDAARPLVSQEVIDRALVAAREHGAAVPALPVPFTIKQAPGPLPCRVERTLARESLWAMQTPQVMRRDALLAAFKACPLPLAQVTDDVQLLELSGQEVWLVPGDERNLKITTPTDLRIAEMLLAAP